jgi:hypothetical protein
MNTFFTANQMTAATNSGFNQVPNHMNDLNMAIWKLLPHVKVLPVEIVRQIPLPSLLQLNAELAKESKSAEKLTVNAWLTQNAQKLAAAPAEVKAGWDDRKEMLHEARFLGGASCSGQYMWMRAREILGPKGVVPIGNYDMDSVGCGGVRHPPRLAGNSLPGLD